MKTNQTEELIHHFWTSVFPRFLPFCLYQNCLSQRDD